MVEPKFRAIPLTLFDFFAIILPGSLWLLLFVSAWGVFIQLTGAVWPSELAQFTNAISFMKFLAGLGTGFGLFIFFLASLMIGYALKPIAMPIAENILMPVFKVIPAYRKIPYASLCFPYPYRYSESTLIISISKVIKQSTGKCPDLLPGKQPFSAAKRLLRHTSPGLWEEGERMEIEVRMIGTLFLASVFGVVIGLIHFIAGAKPPAAVDQIAWVKLIISMVFAPILGLGFLRLRRREVDYTYLNLMLTAQNNSENRRENFDLKPPGHYCHRHIEYLLTAKKKQKET